MRVIARTIPPLKWHRPTCQPGSHATCYHRDMFLRRQPDHLADLIRRAGQNDHIRAALLEGSIVAVNCQIFGGGENAIFPDYFFKLC